jgi:transposase
MVDTKHKPGRSGKVERRRHSAAFKRRVIEQSLVPGASVARIALDNGLNTNLLFKWRRQHVRARRAESPAMLPVAINAALAPEALHLPGPSPVSRTVAGGMIEIELAAARIRIKGTADLGALRLALQMLSTPA